MVYNEDPVQPPEPETLMFPLETTPDPEIIENFADISSDPTRNENIVSFLNI